MAVRSFTHQHSILRLIFLVWVLSAAFSTQATAQVSVKGYTPPETQLSVTERARQGEAPMSRRYRQVWIENAPVVRLGPTSAGELRGEVKSLKHEKRLRIGVIRKLPNPIETAEETLLSEVPEGRIGVVKLVSEGALAIRVHLENVSLPENATIFVYSADNPDHIDGPYKGRGPAGDGSTWTQPLSGSALIIEYFIPAVAPPDPGGRGGRGGRGGGGGGGGGLPFTITELAHNFRDGDQKIGAPPQVGNCHNEVPGEWSEAAKSVGKVEVVSTKGVFACSGVLLNTTDNSGIPYFLTAAHCVTSQAEATHLTVRWFNYDGPGYSEAPISRGGAYLSFAEGSDFALVRLSSVPAGVRFSGWTTADPAISTGIVSIHHPDNSYQRYSRGRTVSADCPGEIGSAFCNNFHKVQWDSGVTEPGSSGAPLWVGSAADPQVIGVLSGGSSSCENKAGLDFFGRFDAAFRSISHYLTGQDCNWQLSDTGRIVRTAGESLTVTIKGVSDKKDCSWTASSNVSWITFTSATGGSGEATISYTVAPHEGSDPRDGALTIAGKELFIIQLGTHNPAACPATSIEIGASPSPRNLNNSGCRSIINPGATAARFSFEGLAGQQIAIVASSTEFDPMALLLGPDGSVIDFNDDLAGNLSNGMTPRLPSDPLAESITLPATGTYTLEVTSFEAGETGTYFLNTQKFCTFKLPIRDYLVSPDGATIEIDVQGPPDCVFQATRKVEWLKFPGGESYNGAQKVKVIVEPATDYAVASWAGNRGTQISLAGQVINITQNLKCGKFLLLKPSAEHGSGLAYNQPLSITTGLHCDWTLTTDVPWIKLVGQTSGRGYIETRYNLETTNLGQDPRIGRVTAGDQSFVVTQQGIGSGCQPMPISIGQTVTGTLNNNCKSITFQPELAVAAGYYTFQGRAGQRVVISATSFSDTHYQHPLAEAWLVTPSSSFPTDTYWSNDVYPEGVRRFQFPQSGYYTLPETGVYTIQFSTGRDFPQPNGTYTLTLDEVAGSGCDMALSSIRQAKNASGDTGQVDLTQLAGGNCSWTASSAAPWLTITSGGTGSGPGSVSYAVAPDNGEKPRTGILIVAGQHVLVTQFSRVGVTVSSADYSTRLAMDGLASIFGVKLAIRTESASAQPLPTKLGGTTVKLKTRYGLEFDCGLIFVSPNQINLVLPFYTFDLPSDSLLEIRSEDGVVTYSQIFIYQRSPSLFSANATGQGVAAAQIIRVKPDSTQIWEDVFQTDQNGKRIARPIDLGPDNEQVFLVLYGTGFRWIESASYVRVEVGEAQPEIYYVGPQSSFAGLAQVNLLLPRSLRGKGETPVRVFVYDQPSNTVTITFSP